MAVPLTDGCGTPRSGLGFQRAAGRVMARFGSSAMHDDVTLVLACFRANEVRIHHVPPACRYR
jgi:hypothetical protein